MPPSEREIPQEQGSDLKKIVEALLFITEKPLSVEDICRVAGRTDQDQVSRIVAELGREAEENGRGFRLMEVAGGFQMATRPEAAPFVRKLYAEKMTLRLSHAALETLAIIAYRQPITRAEVEEVRGVDALSALETLLEKGFVKVAGRRESLGRPLLYGTTPDFLRRFGLKSLSELPPIDSFAPAKAEGTPAADQTAAPESAVAAEPPSSTTNDVLQVPADQPSEDTPGGV